MRRSSFTTRRLVAASFQAFAARQSGAIAVLFVVLLPVLLLAGGLAIDLMNINSERRYVQAQADLAALSAASGIASAAGARAAARATVAANGSYPAFELPDVDIEFGTSAGLGGFDAASDQSTTAGATAVRVAVTAPVRLFVLDLFMSEEGLVVRREAVAAVEPPRVSFALSNCLAELTLLNGLLQPLIGAEVDVLCSGRGVDTRVELFQTLGDFALAANLLTPSGEPVTYGEVLDAELPVADVLSVLTGVAVPPVPGVVRLGDALVLSEDLRRLQVDTPVHAVQIQAADLVLLTAELMAQRVAEVEAELNLGPFANLRAAVRVGEPRRVVLNVVPGSPEAYAQTAQIRVEIHEIDILGLFTLQMDLRLANATATLTNEGDACGTGSADVVAVFDPVDASLIDLDLTTRAQGLPLGSEALALSVDSVQTRDTRRVSFTRQQYDEAPVVQLGPVGPDAITGAVDVTRSTLAAMLNDSAEAINDANATPACTGILGCVRNTLGVLGSLLSTVANNLVAGAVNIANGLGAEGTLTNAVLEDLLGLEIARADLELLDVVCGSSVPRLVR